MRKILSVIIPVYNMEKYIRQCLESLMIREILDKIEILVYWTDQQTGQRRSHWNFPRHIRNLSG